MLMNPPSRNLGSLWILALFIQSESAHARGEKMSPTLEQAASVSVAIYILEGEGKKKKPNLCWDEECVGAPRKHERWEGRFHISIAHDASTRLLPASLLHPFHYS